MQEMLSCPLSDQAEALEASAYELTFDGVDATVRRTPFGDVVFLGSPGDP